RRDLVGTREGEVFGREFGRQDLDHRLVLEPDFDDMERPAIAAEAVPALAPRDRFDLVGGGGDAERKMRRAVAARPLLHKAAAVAAARVKLGSRRVDLYTRPVLVELQREKASRIGRKRDRLATHELGQNPGDMLRVTRGDG